MRIGTDRLITIEWNAADLDQFAEEVYRLQRATAYMACNSASFEFTYPLIYRILREAS